MPHDGMLPAVRVSDEPVPQQPAAGDVTHRSEPDRAGCHHCGAPAEVQWQRHATDAEYEAIATSTLRPTDGRLTVAVLACGDHEIEPFCQHAPPEPAPCPTCQAAPGSLCSRADGSPRRRTHPEREVQPIIDTCTHAHRADCGGYGQCRCSADDPAPPRTPYDALPSVSPAERVAALTKIHEAELAWYSKLLQEAGNDAPTAASLARQAFGEFMQEQLAAAQPDS
jgi:hypothetical protein